MQKQKKDIMEIPLDLYMNTEREENLNSLSLETLAKLWIDNTPDWEEQMKRFINIARKNKEVERGTLGEVIYKCKKL